MSGPSGSGFSWSTEPATSPCSTWRSTANFEVVISRSCKSTMSALAAESEIAPPSFRKRPVGRCSLKLPSKPEPRSGIGFPRWAAERAATCSRAASGRNRTYRHGNMPGLFIGGSKAPGWIAPPTVHIRCGGRRRRIFTRKQDISGRFSFSSGTRTGKHGPLSRNRSG
jgi:hypothetical protein